MDHKNTMIIFIFSLLLAVHGFRPCSHTTVRPHTTFRRSPVWPLSGAVLDNEEPLSVMFQRAVVLQRAGDHKAALKEYELFIKAAKQCDVSPEKFAEVHVNIGSVYVKDQNKEMAKHYFEQALTFRPMGTAHVNLALLALQKGSNTMDPRAGTACLEEAKNHCEKAVGLNDDTQAKQMATRLLEDIDQMLRQSTGQR